MSQRLLLRNSKQKNEHEGVYDLVLTEEIKLKQAEDLLMKEYFRYDGIGYVGPWKINIMDTEVYYKFESIIKKVFKRFKQKYPNDVWVFYMENKRVEHPTRKELLEILGGER